jgi:hypothetical protein
VAPLNISLVQLSLPPPFAEMLKYVFSLERNGRGKRHRIIWKDSHSKRFYAQIDCDLRVDSGHTWEFVDKSDPFSKLVSNCRGCSTGHKISDLWLTFDLS